MKNTNKVILGAIVLLLSTGVAFSSASASAPTAGAAEEIVKQTTGDMAKEAAGEVVDSAKEKAIGLAKEQADKAVDAGVEKATEALNPADVVKKAAE